MSLTTIEVNGTNYQSYASLEEGNLFLQVEPVRFTEWSGQTDTAKQRLLIAATRRVDALVFIGSKTNADQTTEWPRMDVPGVADDVIPPRVEQAAILLASTFISTPEGAEPSQETTVKTIKAGSVEITNFSRREHLTPAPTARPESLMLIDARADLLLRPYVLHVLPPTTGTGQTEGVPLGGQYYSDKEEIGPLDPDKQFDLSRGFS